MSTVSLKTETAEPISTAGMAPKAAAEKPPEDPAAAAEALLTTNLDALQSDDPEARVQALEAIGGLCGTEEGAAVVGRRSEVLLLSLIHI